MKKYIIVALFLCALAVTPALAQTSIADQIAQLKATIAQLTGQLQQLLAQQNQNGFCYNFNHDLKSGDKNDPDLTQLETALVHTARAWGDAGFNNIFDDYTFKIVKEFQTKYSIPATGYVGPLTRAKLNSLYGCKKLQVSAFSITGVSGPTTLKVGENGQWTIKVGDPSNGILNYEVSWGDEAIKNMRETLAAGIAAAPEARQNVTFNHTYQQLGNYTIKFSVTGTGNQIAQAAITVNVTNQAQPTITLTSPNGGEQWVAKSVHDINWSAANLGESFAAQKYDLYLTWRGTASCTSTDPGCNFKSYVLDKNIMAGPYHWIVATDIVNNPIPAGQYRVQVCMAGSQVNCDSSDQPFTIVDQNQAHITVLSPNGGEQWVANSVQDIKWDVSGFAAIPEVGVRVDLNLIPEPPACVYSNPRCMIAVRAPYVLDKNIAANAVYHWIVATDINNQVIPGGNYRIQFCFAGSTTNCDSSDQPFTITAATY